MTNTNQTLLTHTTTMTRVRKPCNQKYQRPTVTQPNGESVKYRSGFEQRVHEAIQYQGQYEPKRLEYRLVKYYTPDILLPNGIYIEAKGLFSAEDKKKMRAIKEQHPKLDIRLIFQRGYGTYAKAAAVKNETWCKKHGFKYAFNDIPPEWMDELPQD
ncbi:endonuclease [Anabaena phage A-4L]|uniref:Endonuclease n=1 Tax=Anabaena phage A-4L TaxID=1357732 RepID=A0A059PY22_9CAUD|nr:endonuclease [Anabaena phage A-4L]AGR48544.1 endonuclease [Anabaena phage A-4L]